MNMSLRKNAVFGLGKCEALLAAAVLTVALVTGVVPPVGAAPLDPRQVSADARWLAHLDLDAVRSTEVAGKIRDTWLGRDVVKRHLENVNRTTGVDLTEDLRGVTIYGKRLVRNTGVVIVQAKVDRKRLLDYLRKKPDFNTARYADWELHNWIERKGAKGEHTVTGCFCTAELLVFARDAGEVKAALDVLGGKAPALAGSRSPLEVDFPQDAVFVAGVIEPAAAEPQFKSPIVNQSEQVSISLGEREGKVFAKLKLVARSDETAEQIQTVVEGFHALALLHHGSDERAMKVLKAFKVATSGKTVTVEWQGAARDVQKLIEKEWKKRQETD